MRDAGMDHGSALPEWYFMVASFSQCFNVTGQ